MSDNRFKLGVRRAILDMIKKGAYRWQNDRGLAVCAYCGQPALLGPGKAQHSDDCLYKHLIEEVFDGKYDL
jgi:hypothetical protein